MVSLLIGIAAAAGASSLYSLGIAIQALDAREQHRDHALRAALAVQLLRRRRWLAGTALTILGWPLQILALAYAPLVVVQPSLAFGLLVLLAAAERLLDEHAGRRELLAVCAIILGVAGVAALAPAHSTTHAPTGTLLVVLSAIALGAAAPYVLRAAGRSMPSAAMLGAGIAFAWSGLVSKFVSDAVSGGHWAAAVGWAAATAIASALALLSEMSALQERPAIVVAPIVFVVQVVVPIAAAPALFDERIGLAMILSLAVLLAGAVTLARSPLLLALTGGVASAQTSDDSGTPFSRSADSWAAKRSSERVDVAEPPTDATTTSPRRS